jgi:hypothetical protein
MTSKEKPGQRSRHGDYATGWMVRGSIPGRDKRLSLLHFVQLGAGPHPVLHLVGNDRSLTRTNAAEA